MKLAAARAAVAAAEAECEQARLRAQASWAGLRGELERAATPGRIVVGGLGLGFVAGKAGPETLGAARMRPAFPARCSNWPPRPCCPA
jgi:hypothetical protein